MTKADSPIMDLLRRDLLVTGDAVSITALGGGVSSDVFLVQDGGKRFVLKRALPRLKVRELWQADVTRNRHEYEYLKYVGAFLPGAVPFPFVLGPEYFTMEYLAPDFSNWKELLLRGNCRVEHARESARVLAIIHKRSANDEEARRKFDTTANFHQLRTHPYLLTTGQRHPALRVHFEEEARRLESTRECLVHGDYSPKNVLVGKERLVLVDCEVAWYGDPAFDVAFLLSHLFLKSLYHMPCDRGLGELIEAAIAQYHSERRLNRGSQQDFDRRTARLLLLLLLARIDGKSPVEYLSDETKREFVRAFVTAALQKTIPTLLGVVNEWFEGLHQRYNTHPQLR